jgi:hypothetical protein
MEPVLTTDDSLLLILDHLRAREPLFHRREVVSSRADFERETAEDFWEVTASGRQLSRESVWRILSERYARSEVDEFDTQGWETRDFHLREIAPHTYLLTYTLWGQGDRLTRRLTVWQGSPTSGWKILFHQGTVVQSPDQLSSAAPGRLGSHSETQDVRSWAVSDRGDGVRLLLICVDLTRR